MLVCNKSICGIDIWPPIKYNSIKRECVWWFFFYTIWISVRRYEYRSEDASQANRKKNTSRRDATTLWMQLYSRVGGSQYRSASIINYFFIFSFYLEIQKAILCRYIWCLIMYQMSFFFALALMWSELKKICAECIIKFGECLSV